MKAKLIIGPGQNAADATVLVFAGEGTMPVPAMDITFRQDADVDGMPLLEGMVDAANGVLALVESHEGSGGGGPR